MVITQKLSISSPYKEKCLTSVLGLHTIIIVRTCMHLCKSVQVCTSLLKSMHSFQHCGFSFTSSIRRIHETYQYYICGKCGRSKRKTRRRSPATGDEFSEFRWWYL